MDKSFPRKRLWEVCELLMVVNDNRWTEKGSFEAWWGSGKRADRCAGTRGLSQKILRFIPFGPTPLPLACPTSAVSWCESLSKHVIGGGFLWAARAARLHALSARHLLLRSSSEKPLGRLGETKERPQSSLVPVPPTARPRRGPLRDVFVVFLINPKFN